MLDEVVRKKTQISPKTDRRNIQRRAEIPAKVFRNLLEDDNGRITGTDEEHVNAPI